MSTIVNHHSIVPFQAKLKGKILGLETDVIIQVIGISTYAGQIPTLIIEFAGAVFYDIGIHDLIQPDNTIASIFTNYLNCPEANSVIKYIDIMKGSWNLFGRYGALADNVEYILTVEWPDANEMIHLLKGNVYWFWPHHKLMRNQKTLPKYPKIKEQRIV